MNSCCLSGNILWHFYTNLAPTLSVYIPPLDILGNTLQEDLILGVNMSNFSNFQNCSKLHFDEPAMVKEFWQEFRVTFGGLGNISRDLQALVYVRK